MESCRFPFWKGGCISSVARTTVESSAIPRKRLFPSKGVPRKILIVKESIMSQAAKKVEPAHRGSDGKVEKERTADIAAQRNERIRKSKSN